MGWRFRRSLKLGSLRLNFSKSGIGYSAGVRGFRVGKDAKGRSYTASSIPGTGLYDREYRSASEPVAQSADSSTSASPQSGAGNGLKLFLAFIAGGVVVSIITAIVSNKPVAPPAPPPAAVSAPVVPQPATPAKRRAHGSKPANAPGLLHRPAMKASHSPQAPPPVSDAPPSSN